MRVSAGMCPEIPPDLRDLPELAPDDARLRWVIDWYDGPLTALVRRANGRLALLVVHDASAIVGEGRWWWVIHALRSEHAELVEREHEAFAREVGTHWCCHDDAHDGESYFASVRSDLRELAGGPVGWIGEFPAIEGRRGEIGS